MASSAVTFRMAGRKGMALLLLAALSPIAGHAAGSPCDWDCGGGNGIRSLDALNSSVNGRVHVNVPFSLPCFSSYEGRAVETDAAACQAIQENYASPTSRTDYPGAYMNSQDSLCSSDPADQCVLDNTDPTDPLAYVGKDRRQGDVPWHYLEVTDYATSKRFQLARSSGTPVVVKYSGHDYLSHSSQKGALALWTRNLQRLEYHDAFVPEGCSAGEDHKHLAITTGTGVNCDQAYDFANENDVTILCAYSETVGISGGWVLTAGHSVLSPVHGLGVDRVLEFHIVTSDGQDLIANAWQNQDLFWALRGGSGGTFGVVMKSTHLVEPRIPMVTADVTFTSNSTTLLEWMGIMLEESAPWAEAGWGGHITGSSLIYVNPILSMDAAKKSMTKATDYATSHGGSAVSSTSTRSTASTRNTSSATP
jgi:hypothetical protein